MRFRSATGFVVLALLCAGAVAPPSAEGQLIKRLKKAAKEAVTNEAENQVDRLLRNAIRCAVDDPICVEQAEESGEDVIFVDDGGEVITDDDGAPITDQEEAAARSPKTAPGEGIWANYDFVPGENVLFIEDFSNDNVGDFPRRLHLVRGNWDVVEWDGQTLLRNTGPRHSALKIALPETLPEKFTIEFPVLLYEGNANLALATSVPAHGNDTRVHHYQHNYFDVGSWGVGVVSRDQADVTATQRVGDALTAGLAIVRIMADGSYVKMYVGERRVANVPNADLVRSDTLWIENTYAASEENPILIGPIRVAGGGRDLYDALAEHGRVATQGVLFATNSDRIRPESTPTLEEIGTMLQEHPDLSIRIEGHTDADGDDTFNQELSERRAAAVRQFLIDRHGIEEARLEAVGFGESQPVGDNDTPEGKQQNRRVELVRM